MEKVNLASGTKDEIKSKLDETKISVQNQMRRFEELLKSKILESYKEVDEKNLKKMLNLFAVEFCKQLDSLFSDYEKNEIDFYCNNLKVADLVFNTLNDKRIQTIYLDNLIKKMNRKNEEAERLFTDPIKINHDDEEIEEYPSLDNIFSKIVQVLIKNPKLSPDESDNLYVLANNYYRKLKTDVVSFVDNFLLENKNDSIIKIEEEMDKQELRNGKTSAISKMERAITSDSLKIIEKKLKEIIEKNKANAVEELKVCSTSIIDLIFKLLPSEYSEQKVLLEIIIETNINERLGKVLESEITKLHNNLKEKNQDVIENELYDEKRYKMIEEYECDLKKVGQVYQDVLHEIRIAYDIPREKKLNLIVLSESDSTKAVFNKLIKNIKNENKKNLDAVLEEMHKLSSQIPNSAPGRRKY